MASNLKMANAAANAIANTPPVEEVHPIILF